MSKLYLGSTEVTLPGAGGGGTADPLYEFFSMGSGVSVPPSATPHTKGAWVQVTASSAEDCTQVTFLADVNLSGVNTATLIDIGVGASGAETIVVPDIACGGWIQSSGSYVHAGIQIPLSIPAGSRIALRSQSFTGSNPTTVALSLWGGGDIASQPVLDIIGSDPATSRGVYAGGTTAWVEVVASTTQDYSSFVVVPSLATAAGTTVAPSLNVGVGAAGSEVELSGRMLLSQSTAEQIQSQYLRPFWEDSCIFPGVPAGSRIVVKSSLNTALHDVCLIGVPA